MKIKISWASFDGKSLEGAKQFAHTDFGKMEEMMKNAGIEMLCTFHSADGSGFSVVETNNIATLSQFALPWSDINNMTFTPVMTREEAQASAKAALAMMAEMG